MGFFDKAKCFTGFHDWSGWSPTDKCDQTRSCVRAGCHMRQSRTEHAWTEYRYVAEGSCVQHRNCERCPATDERTAPHEWTEWQYAQAQNCEQARTCERCAKAEARTTHVWTDVWQYAAPKSCHQVQLCRRCPEGRKERAPTAADHRWGPHERIDCTHTKATCLRCEKPDIDELLPQRAVHQFGQPAEMPSGKWRWRCRQCTHTAYSLTREHP